jgi:acetyl-CoA carboxylase biotin carboxylase subunit
LIKKLLIANRGEIAVRVIRACKEMGIETVAVYSSADKESLHVKMADSAVCVGPPAASRSYLVKENLIQAALKTGCEALHPGVGFLSESADFARAVTESGLIFIGPHYDVIALLGDKVKARKTAKHFGLPITPGTENAVSGVQEALKALETLPLPVIIKAAGGGGGKGMRIVRHKNEIAENLEIAIREAEANFADGRVFIERYIENPRHVELQILSDGNGKVVVLGERDCSVQRNHQKLIEESPSPAVSDDMRFVMKEGALAMFRELKYQGAGTIEFLVENDQFYFMEVNARVQVEHPVSEFVSNTDIIREQILACTSGKMDIDSENITLSGAAIECRINALSPGKITRLETPGGPGVRFDSFLYNGCFVPPYYDSMVAKLIVYSATRDRAIARMKRALDELCIEGIKTNREEQISIINHPVFRSGKFGTSFIKDEIESKNGGQ